MAIRRIGSEPEEDVPALFLDQVGGWNPLIAGQQINLVVACGTLTPAEEQHIQNYVNSSPPGLTADEIRAHAVALGLLSPSFSRY